MNTAGPAPRHKKRIIAAGVIAATAGLAVLVLYLTGVLRPAEKPAVSANFSRPNVTRSKQSSDVSAMALRQYFLGDVDGAVATLDQALKAEPAGSIDRVFLLRDKGNIQMSADRYDDAIATYTLAVSLDPDNAVTREGLGQAYASAGRKQEARAAFQKQLELAKKADLPIQIEDATRNLQELDE